MKNKIILSGFGFLCFVALWAVADSVHTISRCTKFGEHLGLVTYTDRNGMCWLKKTQDDEQDVPALILGYID